jgi:hypothetical protein
MYRVKQMIGEQNENIAEKRGEEEWGDAVLRADGAKPNCTRTNWLKDYVRRAQ